MKIGAHVSAAGGVSNAPKNAAALGLECFQFFSRPPQSGRTPELSDDEVRRFRGACDGHGFDECFIHAPYIINLASAERRIRDNSVRLLREELERGSRLGVTGMMTHLGSARDVGQETALQSVAEGLRRILDDYDGPTRLIIENSAGAGMIIGDEFEEISDILDRIGDSRVGVCLDTAHALASGYDLRTPETVAETMERFDRTIGLGRLLVIHTNDSKIELGGHKDLHEHIGLGHIGLAGFRSILANPAFADLCLILETPVDGVADDIKTLKSIRQAVWKGK
ncbi:hypothetical protein AMJ57_05530 [Parcubacteria bacterium SG8_24]|nr:MAG: hypothetical protein AMJ57_05530 [Parcubacteria bacterium SG8_24]